MADSTFSVPDISHRPPSPDNSLPIGLIGCGNITDLHLEAYRDAGYDVMAFCDVEESRARARRDEYFPDADVYTDHESLLARDDVSVVDVATHPGPRPAIIADALRADKHVLSQKPFVEDLADAKRLVEIAAEENRKIAVNQNGRWAPYFTYLRSVLDGGYLGDLVSAHVDLHWNHDGGFDDPHHLFYRFAIHFMDQIACLFPDRAERVYARTTRASNQASPTPLLASIDIAYPDRQATITLDGTVRAGVNFRTYVAGSDASVEITGPDEPWDAGPDAPLRYPWQHTTLTTYTPDGAYTPELFGSWNTTGFAGAMGELQHAIEMDREPDHSGRNNLETMRLCFAACASAVDGEPKQPGEVTALPPE